MDKEITRCQRIWLQEMTLNPKLSSQAFRKAQRLRVAQKLVIMFESKLKLELLDDVD